MHIQDEGKLNNIQNIQKWRRSETAGDNDKLNNIQNIEKWRRSETTRDNDKLNNIHNIEKWRGSETATCKSIASWVGMMKLAFCSRNDAFTPFRNVQKKS